MIQERCFRQVTDLVRVTRAMRVEVGAVVPNVLPSSSTVENSLALLAFSAMTFSLTVSLATSR
jgi:hypothetical protein